MKKVRTIYLSGQPSALILELPANTKVVGAAGTGLGDFGIVIVGHESSKRENRTFFSYLDGEELDEAKYARHDYVGTVVDPARRSSVHVFEVIPHAPRR